MRHSMIMLIILIGLLTACASTAAPTATPVPTPTPQELSTQIGQATQAESSVHFVITLTGKPVYTDTSGIFAINSMEGDLQRPDSALALLNVTTNSALAEIRTVAIAGKQYLTNPLTREWMCVDPGIAFNPAILFDPEKGIEHLLQSGLDAVSLVGIEDLDGKPHYHLQASISGEKLQPISMGLLGVGPVTINIWADQATLRASKMVLVDTTSDATNPTTWSVVFRDYGKTVDVRAPADC